MKHITKQSILLFVCKTGVKVNGFVCKGYITAEDFFFAGLAKAGQINSSVGSIGTAANVMKIPGLNALGLSMSRIDYAPGGLNPPHTHPRASEIVFVLEGELEMGFITTSNVLISKKIKQGQIFVFPKGLIHYQKNNGNVPAAVIAAFNSQYPGVQPIGPSLFAASPPVPDYVLAKALQIDNTEVEKFKTKFAPKK